MIYGKPTDDNFKFNNKSLDIVLDNQQFYVKNIEKLLNQTNSTDYHKIKKHTRNIILKENHLLLETIETR